MMQVVGINHRTADLAWRERVAWPTAEIPALLQRLEAELGCEAVLLSTCNRTELYLAARSAGDLPSPPAVIPMLTEPRGLLAPPPPACWYSVDGPAALRHLFRVAASLDSLVLGEAQIAGQVLAAYELAARAGTVGPVLHAGFQRARQVAKRVRRETALTAGKVSVASLAIDYLRQVFDRFDNKTVLVVGAGKMGETALRHLHALHPKTILITNRSPERSETLAKSCGGQVLPWEHLSKGLARAHIVLSATGAQTPIITAELFAAVRPFRHGEHLAILDLAVPRDVEPLVGDFEEVDLLVNLDDLHQVRAGVLRDRERHIPAAEAIVSEELEAFQKEWARRWAGPAIAALSAECDAIRRSVEARCFSKLNGKLTAEDKQIIAGALRLLQNKLLHAPIAAVREEVQAGRRGLLDAVIRLFRLKT